MVRDGSWRAAWDIFFTADNANKTYVPLTMLTFFYENMFFGLHPGVSHGINLVLHLAVCGLVFVLGRSLGFTRFASYAGALLFAVHPLHVEPVAWVTARKDLLYSFFYLIAMLSYLRYIDSGRIKDFAFALIAAGLSVLAKPMALSLPAVFFLLDWYRARPFSWQLLIEKLPFFLVVEPIAWVTYAMNARESHFSWNYSPLLWIWCAVFYVQKFFFPFDLAAVYGGLVPVSLGNPGYLYSVLLLIILSLAVWYWRRTKPVIFAAGLYGLSLFFIWRFDFYDLTFVADRFMYLSSIGLCFLFGLLAGKLWEGGYRYLFRPILLVFLLVVMVFSYARVSVWKNSYALWKNNVKRYPSSFALNAYGESLLEENCFKDNRDDFIRYVSGSTGASSTEFRKVFRNSLEAKINAARRIEALKSFRRVLAVDPNNLNAIANVGMVYTILKSFDKAIPYFSRVILLSRGLNSEYFFNRGVAYEYLGDKDSALADYDRAVALDGEGSLPACLNRANIRLARGELDRAMEDVFGVMQAAPEYIRAYDLAIQVAQAKKDPVLAGNIKKLRDFYKRKAVKR